jgi:hypothetical protein
MYKVIIPDVKVMFRILVFKCSNCNTFSTNRNGSVVYGPGFGTPRSQVQVPLYAHCVTSRKILLPVVGTLFLFQALKGSFFFSLSKCFFLSGCLDLILMKLVFFCNNEYLITTVHLYM